MSLQSNLFDDIEVKIKLDKIKKEILRSICTFV